MNELWDLYSMIYSGLFIQSSAVALRSCFFSGLSPKCSYRQLALLVPSGRFSRIAFLARDLKKCTKNTPWSIVEIYQKYLNSSESSGNVPAVSFARSFGFDVADAAVKVDLGFHGVWPQSHNKALFLCDLATSKVFWCVWGNVSIFDYIWAIPTSLTGITPNLIFGTLPQWVYPRAPAFDLPLGGSDSPWLGTAILRWARLLEPKKLLLSFQRSHTPAHEFFYLETMKNNEDPTFP